MNAPQSIGITLLLGALALSSKLAGCSREEPDSGAAAKSVAASQNNAQGTTQQTAVKASPEACLACEKADPGCSTLIDICSTLEGVAKEGPRAGTSKKELCQAAMACVERTRCATEHVSRCYCGGTQGTECLEGKANGQCKAELEAALESTDPMVVARRFDEEGFAGSVALWRAHCQHRVCKAQCF